jgi:SAM-dependent methyltransferase
MVLIIYELFFMSSFLFFQTAVRLAHEYWTRLLQPGDSVIDATCGNGHDTLFLAQSILSNEKGRLYACDIQEKAILATKERLEEHLSSEQFDSVEFVHACHSIFPVEIQKETLRLVVYNLGYLPNSDKALTTCRESTIKSLENALDLILPGGVISVTCYPGHEEGLHEEAAILDWVESLDAKRYSCCHHRFVNRKRAPSLLLIEKQSDQKRKIVQK